jgi:hypothetical protein
MKITGYKIQHKLKELEEAKEVTAQQFNDGILQFASQAEKTDIREVFARYTSLERNIAALQTLQAQYNLQVNVSVLGETMPLHQAVKLVGGAGRSQKMWKEVVKGKKNARYSFSEPDGRNKDTEYASRSVPMEEALKHSQHASRLAGSLREAIQVGNATEIELNTDESLFA